MASSYLTILRAKLHVRTYEIFDSSEIKIYDFSFEKKTQTISRGGGLCSFLLFPSSELPRLGFALVLDDLPILPLVVLPELGVRNKLVHERSFPVLKEREYHKVLSLSNISKEDVSLPPSPSRETEKITSEGSLSETDQRWPLCVCVSCWKLVGGEMSGGSVTVYVKRTGTLLLIQYLSSIPFVFIPKIFALHCPIFTISIRKFYMYFY
jgi:hypothetical protein